MDDLLWILTDSQMKAAIIFARHLKHKIDQSSEQSKRIAARTLRVRNHHTGLFIVFKYVSSSVHVINAS